MSLDGEIEVGVKGRQDGGGEGWRDGEMERYICLLNFSPVQLLFFPSSSTEIKCVFGEFSEVLSVNLNT